MSADRVSGDAEACRAFPIGSEDARQYRETERGEVVRVGACVGGNWCGMSPAGNKAKNKHQGMDERVQRGSAIYEQLNRATEEGIHGGPKEWAKEGQQIQ
jgi:hypothetical protein